MKHFIWSLVCAAALAVTGPGLAGNSVHASDYAPGCRHEWVLCYEIRQVSYTVYETRYDYCGRSYQVRVTRSRTERVPVWRQIALRR